MNNLIENRNVVGSVGSFAVVGLTAAMASGHVCWPVSNKPIYTAERAIASYSAFTVETLKIQPTSAIPNFAQEISAFYSELTRGQSPLGAEFEAVWDANVDRLYES